jgi:hypothetical protein
VMIGLEPIAEPQATERVEVKFNPWHDPKDGRFTFRQGGSISGGGGGFGGGGATGRFNVPSRPRPKSTTSQTPKPVVSVPKPSPSATDRMHRITENGYDFDLDSDNRTRRAGGTVRLDSGQRRSRSVQRRAGVPDRLPSDEGGHYVAREFGGPDKDFNHFAQEGAAIANWKGIGAR